MKVEKIDHIHIFVNDIEKATGFFSSLMNTKFSRILDLEELNAKSAMEPLGIELISSISLDGPVAQNIKRRGEGVAAISLKVPDIEEAISELQSRGVRLVRRVEKGRLKEAQFHPKDSFGVMIELCEYQLEPDAHIAAFHYD